MNPNKLKTSIVKIICLLMLISPILVNAKSLPKITVDGLELIKDNKHAAVYAKPGSSLEPYTKVILVDAYVAFKKSWERDQRQSSINRLRISPKVTEDIKTKLAEEFHTVFSEELKKSGYQIVDAVGEDVLTLRPAIINLDVNAPNSINTFTRVYTSSAGEMTLYLEFYDSVTGDLFAKAVDQRVDRTFDQYYTWSNSSTNKSAADRIIRGWAKILIKVLNESKSIGNS